MKAPSRTVAATGLLVALLAVLLVAWFFAGWSDVRARQADERTRPAAAAARRAEDLARDLRAELDTLVGHEIERPYFHYQNLFRDPRASASIGVAPSPLAAGDPDPLVLGYFQIDAAGKVTLPTLNDDVPELSDQKRLAQHLAFRTEVTRSLVATYRPPATATPALVAQADPATPRTPRTPRKPRTSPDPPPQGAQVLLPPDAGVVAQNTAGAQATFEVAPTVQSIDNVSYQQNNYSNSIYLENNPAQQQRAVPPTRVPPLDVTTEVVDAGVDATTPDAAGEDLPGAATATAAVATATAPRTPPARPQVAAPGVTAQIARLEKTQVTIVVSPLSLETELFGGAPVLVATRLVETPDGALTQGFVIDRAQMERWLATRDADAHVVYRAPAASTAPAGTAPASTAAASTAPASTAPASVTPATASRPLVASWAVEVTPPATEVAAAAASAAKLATTFLVRFVALGSLALVAAALVIVMVSRAERLARERSQFAAAAAHELRTPLAGLQLYGDMLADGMGDPTKQRDYARRMAEEAARLGRVVSNVLGFSQLERGNLSVTPAPGDVAAELGELAARAEPALDRAGAMLALEVTPGLRATFDRDALARIVGNLLDNAEKYSRDAEDRTITLAARAIAGDAGGVEISVTDHGPGVSAAARAKLFAPFARGVDADGPAGLGLGLALSQSLARAMGGELVYRPPAEGGAGFVLRLAA